MIDSGWWCFISIPFIIGSSKNPLCCRSRFGKSLVTLPTYANCATLNKPQHAKIRNSAVNLIAAAQVGSNNTLHIIQTIAEATFYTGKTPGVSTHHISSASETST